MDLPVLQTESARDEGVRTIMIKMGYHEKRTDRFKDQNFGNKK